MESRNANVLVIGGAGFVGSHIVDQLAADGVGEIRVFDNFARGAAANLAAAVRSGRVEVIEGSITDLPALKRATQGADHVFHLAALWLGECHAEPRKGAEVNVMGTLNVLDACRAADVERVVFSSSASVYGDAVATPMTEDHPFNNRTFYGATKIAGEQFFRAYHEMYGLDYVGLRYMNVYGPRMDDKGTYVSVIVKVLERVLQGQRPVIHGDGTQCYDFVHVEDVARCNVLALRSGVTDDFFNVGTGVKTSINELVGMLLQVLRSDLKPEYKPQGQVFVTHRVGSTEKAERLLGFRARVPLDKGLQSYAEWHLATKGRAA